MRCDAVSRTAVRGVLVAAALLAATSAIPISTAQEGPLTVTTADGIELSVVLAVPESEAPSLPAVVFIHQGGSSKDEWVRTDLFDDVVRQGWIGLAYDIRGHGESSGEVDFDVFFDDPEQAPRDLRAVIDYLIADERVDADRIAVVGASIGANLACVAAGNTEFPVKTAVAISGKTSAVINLAGGAERLGDLRSVFLIASEFEQDGQRADWALELYGRTAVPRRLEIVGASGGHGVSIFADDTTLQRRILDWLKATL